MNYILKNIRLKSGVTKSDACLHIKRTSRLTMPESLGMCSTMLTVYEFEVENKSVCETLSEVFDFDTEEVLTLYKKAEKEFEEKLAEAESWRDSLTETERNYISILLRANIPTA